MTHPAVIRRQIVVGAVNIGRRLGMSASTVYRRRDELPVWQTGVGTSPLKAFSDDLDRWVAAWRIGLAAE